MNDFAPKKLEAKDHVLLTELRRLIIDMIGSSLKKTGRPKALQAEAHESDQRTFEF